MVYRTIGRERRLGDKMSSSLEKALERFDKLSEKQLSEIARRMIRGATQFKRKAKTRGLQKA